MIPASAAGSAEGRGDAATWRLAGFGRRLASLFYEALMLAAILLIVGFALLPLVSPMAPGSAPSAQQLYVLPRSSRAFVLVVYLAVTGIYFTAFWTKGRRTLPMKTWGLGFARVTGGELDLRHAIVRYFAAWIGPVAALSSYHLVGRLALLAMFANFVWAWVDRDGQFLHDRIAGTRIVRR